MIQANRRTDGQTDRQAEVRRESESVSSRDGRESETFKQMVGQARWTDRWMVRVSERERESEWERERERDTQMYKNTYRRTNGTVCA